MTIKFHNELDAFEARVRAEQADRDLAFIYANTSWTPREYASPATQSQLRALCKLCLQNNTPEYRSAAIALDNAIDLLIIAAHADESHDALERDRDIESLR